MSLMTRCPACATVFRVVQDQLRVSDGWVRCGRCGEVFNAIEGLVDASGRTATPPPRVAAPAIAPSQPPTAVPPAPPPAPLPPPPAPPPPPPAQAEVVPPGPASDDDVPVDDAVLAEDDAVTVDGDSGDRRPGEQSLDIEIESAAAPEAAASPAAPERPDIVAEDDRFIHSASTTAPPADDPTTAAPEPELAGPDADDRPGNLPPPDSELADAEEPAAPSFVRRADRAARWRHPAVRALLAVLVLAGLLGLAAQVTYHQGDRVAAGMPALRPQLAQACGLLGCRIGELRQIEALAVENSGLVRVEGTALYRLSVTLRNQSSLEVATPAIDLSLTDAQGQLIARRVLTMVELGVAARTVKPAAELPIQVSLGVGDRAVSGYTVEIFYP